MSQQGRSLPVGAAAAEARREADGGAARGVDAAGAGVEAHRAADEPAPALDADLDGEAARDKPHRAEHPAGGGGPEKAVGALFGHRLIVVRNPYRVNQNRARNPDHALPKPEHVFTVDVMDTPALPSPPMSRSGPQRRRVSGLHLRAAREAKGYSREFMAQLLDTRLATISERENARDVSWDTWLGWAMALGLTFDEAQAAPAVRDRE